MGSFKARQTVSGKQIRWANSQISFWHIQELLRRCDTVRSQLSCLSMRVANRGVHPACLCLINDSSVPSTFFCKDSETNPIARLVVRMMSQTIRLIWYLVHPEGHVLLTLLYWASILVASCRPSCRCWLSEGSEFPLIGEHPSWATSASKIIVAKTQLWGNIRTVQLAGGSGPKFTFEPASQCPFYFPPFLVIFPSDERDCLPRLAHTASPACAMGEM